MNMMKTALACLACVLMLAGSARAADDCRLWTGIWDVAYDNGTDSVWTIDAYDNDPDSPVILCNATGTEEITGGGERPLYIMYITFSKSYYFAYSAVKPSMDTPAFNIFIDGDTLNSTQKNLTGTRRPGSGPMPENPCPAEKLLGADSRQAQALRLVRDRVLAKSSAGRWLIALYYGHASQIMEALDGHPAARTATAALLRQLAAAADKVLR